MIIRHSLISAKTDYSNMLTYLSSVIGKKYNIMGYATDYIIDENGANVSFQEINKPKRIFELSFDEMDD